MNTSETAWKKRHSYAAYNRAAKNMCRRYALRDIFQKQRGICPLCAKLMHQREATAMTIESKRPRMALVCSICATGKPFDEGPNKLPDIFNPRIALGV